MIKVESLLKARFRDYVNKRPSERDGVKRFVYWGLYKDRHLSIRLEQDASEEGFKILEISYDHSEGKLLMEKLFGFNPSVEYLLEVLQLINRDE